MLIPDPKNDENLIPDSMKNTADWDLMCFGPRSWGCDPSLCPF